MERQPAVYLLSNKNNTVLYTGVTSDLVKRIWQHRQKIIDGFTKKYNCTRLLYFEVFMDMESAIAREKLIKGGSRKKKEQLINGFNPDWRDLYEEII
jgi:putative endonuclease